MRRLQIFSSVSFGWQCYKHCVRDLLNKTEYGKPSTAVPWLMDDFWHALSLAPFLLYRLHHHWRREFSNLISMGSMGNLLNCFHSSTYVLCLFFGPEVTFAQLHNLAQENGWNGWLWGAVFPAAFPVFRCCCLIYSWKNTSFLYLAGYGSWGWEQIGEGREGRLAKEAWDVLLLYLFLSSWRPFVLDLHVSNSVPECFPKMENGHWDFIYEGCSEKSEWTASFSLVSQQPLLVSAVIGVYISWGWLMFNLAISIYPYNMLLSYVAAARSMHLVHVPGAAGMGRKWIAEQNLPGLRDGERTHALEREGETAFKRAKDKGWARTQQLFW